jgi:hypothetical protein
LPLPDRGGVGEGQGFWVLKHLRDQTAKKNSKKGLAKPALFWKKSVENPGSAGVSPA